jgi:hypothetical protein
MRTPFRCRSTDWNSLPRSCCSQTVGTAHLGLVALVVLLTGTAGSLAANIATAHQDPVSRLIAGWSAVTLLISSKLLSSILEHRQAANDLTGVLAPAPGISDDRRALPERQRWPTFSRVPAGHQRPRASQHSSPTVRASHYPTGY